MLRDHRLGWDRPTASGLAEGLSGRIRCPSSTQQFRGSGLLTLRWDSALPRLGDLWQRYGARDHPVGLSVTQVKDWGSF